jgi:D-aminoacyl-tRNA deacylase
MWQRWLRLLLLLRLPTVAVVSAAMRIVIQRVKSASVTVDDEIISQIGPGIMALVGIHEHDTTAQALDCCKQLLGCKLWSHPETGALWRQNIKQRQYELLLVSQFTLYGTLGKQYKTDFKLAMKTIPAQTLYNHFVHLVSTHYIPEKVKDGRFGAMMDVSLVNDGPVTLIIESLPPPPLPLPLPLSSSITTSIVSDVEGTMTLLPAPLSTSDDQHHQES